MTIADRAAQLAADECRLDEDERARFRRHMDRPPRCAECGGHGGHSGHCMSYVPHVPPWRSWFDAEGNYLGNRSGRVTEGDGDGPGRALASQNSNDRAESIE